MFGDAFGHGGHERRAADVAHLRTVGDEGDFLIGLDHAHSHARRGDVDKRRLREGGLKCAETIDGQVIHLDADARCLRQA